MESFKNIAYRKSQPALGDILLQARKDLGLTKQEVAEAVGISISAVTKYEKAGHGGDTSCFPRSPVLARLCYFLKVPSSKAYWSCLLGSEFEQASEEAFHDLQSHPSNIYLNEQYEALLQENRFYKEALKWLLLCDQAKDKYNEENQWYRQELLKLISRHEDFTSRMLEWGCYTLQPKVKIAGGENTDDAWVDDIRNNGILSERSDYPKLFLVHSALSELQRAVDNILNNFPGLDKMTTEEVMAASFRTRKSPEDDLPSPPSSADET